MCGRYVHTSLVVRFVRLFPEIVNSAAVHFQEFFNVTTSGIAHFAYLEVCFVEFAFIFFIASRPPWMFVKLKIFRLHFARGFSVFCLVIVWDLVTLPFLHSSGCHHGATAR